MPLPQPLPQVDIRYNPSLTQRIREDLPDKSLDTHLNITFDTIGLWENKESIPSAHELIRLYFFCCQNYDSSEWSRLPFWVMGDGLIEVPLNLEYVRMQQLGRKKVNMKKMQYNSRAIENLCRKVGCTKKEAYTFIRVANHKVTSWGRDTATPDANELGYIYQLYRENFKLLSAGDHPLEAPLGLHYEVPINFLLQRNGT